jgi:hypothetical protein
VCGGADRIWTKMGDRWLAYSSENPAASDEWSLQHGEAAFMHGRTGA